MYFFILILCVNTIASMINTNPFFDFTAGPGDQCLEGPGRYVKSVFIVHVGVLVV